MSYVSKRGKRPAEFASKAAHVHVIRDEHVQVFLQHCQMPKDAVNVELGHSELITMKSSDRNVIRHIIAVDSGYDEEAVRVEFPSATVCFFQFGALVLDVDDLEALEEQPFIDPDDMAKLKRIQRLKLTIPVRNITYKSATTLTESVRLALYEFFMKDIEGDRLMDSLRWLIFQEFHSPVEVWTLARCPICDAPGVELIRDQLTREHTTKCSTCGGDIFLTDVFRLHEAIDDELGASGVLGYLTTTVEHIIVAHLIRLILRTKPSLLGQILFIKDGPLAFFGQTANMHKPMRALVSYLFDRHNLFLAGLEKSGPFVEHADAIAATLQPGQTLLLGNPYIYKYIIPGKADPSNPYGRTTYYGNKLIYKTQAGRMYVVTLPTRSVLFSPETHDFPNLEIVLMNIEKLRCDMYDDALIPVALVNKLVSLANHPSSRILQKFAVDAMTR